MIVETQRFGIQANKEIDAMNLFRTTFVILLMVVMAGFSASYAAEKPVENTKAEVKTNDSEILKSLTAPESVIAEEYGEASPTILVEDMMIGSPTATVEFPPATIILPLPSKELLLSILSTIDDEEFQKKIDEASKDYEINEAKVKERRTLLLKEQSILKAEYAKCPKGDNTGLSKMAVVSEEVFLNYHICKKLETGTAECKNLKSINNDMFDTCVKEDQNVMFLKVLPIASSKNLSEDYLTQESKNICGVLKDSERGANCEDVVALMLKTINISLHGKDRTSCGTLSSIEYKQYCEAVFDRNPLYCSNPDRQDKFNLCFDRFFQRLVAIIQKDYKLFEAMRENNDLKDILTAWYISPTACEYYAGTDSKNYCDVLKAMVDKRLSDDLVNWVSKYSLNETLPVE